MTGLDDVERVQLLTVAPDETLVLTCPGTTNLTVEQVDRFKATAQEAFGTERVVVIGGGITLSKVKIEPEDDWFEVGAVVECRDFDPLGIFKVGGRYTVAMNDDGWLSFVETNVRWHCGHFIRVDRLTDSPPFACWVGLSLADLKAARESVRPVLASHAETFAPYLADLEAEITYREKALA